MPESHHQDDMTMVQVYAFAEHDVCHESDAPSSVAEKAICTTTTIPYTEGIPGTARQITTGEDSGIITLLVATFLFVATGFRHCSRLFKIFAQDLWTVRRRANAFDDRTANETHVLITLIIQTCVYESILLLAMTGKSIPPEKAFTATIMLLGITCCLYLFQLASYGLIGYVFSDKTGKTQWIKGFNASQSLLGFTLIVPALFSLFYPPTIPAMLILSAILYMIARIIFICKGFRIFYHNFSSLLYFILYLCTVEIIPVILAYSGTIFLSGAIQ